MFLALVTSTPSHILSPEIAYAEEMRVYSIQELIDLSADRYGVAREILYLTLKCESAGFTVLEGQSQIPDTSGPNGYENSWGIAQFNLPSDLKTADGREITKEIAIVPVEAIDAAAYNFSIGNAGRWSC